MGNDKDNIETMVPYTLNDDTPKDENLNDGTPNDNNSNDDTFNNDTLNNGTPNDEIPSNETLNNDSKAIISGSSNDNAEATILGTSRDQGRKVVINPTDDELLAAQGLLELFQEARVFSTPEVSTFNLSHYKIFHLPLKANHEILISQMPTYPVSININSRLLAGTRRSEFPLYPFFTNQVGTGNPSLVGGVDRSQNVSPLYSPFSPRTSFKEANDIPFARMGSVEGSGSPVYPPVCPYSTSTNIEEVKGIAASVLLPSFLPPFSPYSTSEVKEEVDNTSSSVKSKKAKKSERKHYLNRNSKKRKADEAYLKKKTDVHQKMELYKAD